MLISMDLSKIGRFVYQFLWTFHKSSGSFIASNMYCAYFGISCSYLAYFRYFYDRYVGRDECNGGKRKKGGK